jgi:ParB-like chromosome segregation protein Spo0J
MTATHKLITTEIARAIIDGIDADAPLREARTYKLLLDAGYDIEEIAGMTGRRPNFIGWRLDLLKLNRRGQATLEAGAITRNLAWAIAVLSPPNQNVMLNRWDRGEFANGRQGELAAKALRADEADATT